MQTNMSWSALRQDVEDRFSELSPGDELVERALSNLDAWLSQPLPADTRDQVLAHVTEKQFPLLLDSFYQLVPFGTGGRRGRVGYGPNRINHVTVARSVQGHCDFLRNSLPSPNSRTVVIAFDTRVFADITNTYAFLGDANLLHGLTSKRLAHIACEIYAGNGFEVYLAGLDSDEQYLSTPELSFAIRHLHAVAGMNVSASHNHPDDNGFKFFNAQGAQDIPPTDQAMASYMGDVRAIDKVPFGDAVRTGKIHPLPNTLHPAYIALNLALRSKKGSPVTVVYTPLCGTGDSTVGDVLRAAGHDVRLFAPHANHDGTFAAVPFRLPNPEVPEAASPALALANEADAELVLCTDPDADRLGAFAKDGQGRWRYLNGNEIASILAYYLTLDRENGPQRLGLLIKTLVTTRMLHKIADISGCTIIPDLLVGFKYIAHVLSCLEAEGQYEGVHSSASNLILAGEESHGVLLTPEIRDKDAAGGAIALCELVGQLRTQNRHLPEYLDSLSVTCGNYHNVARNIVMRGIRGANRLAVMMKSLRDHPPDALGNWPIVRSRDLLSPEYGPLRSETERLSRNLIVFETKQAQVVIRPSGTEPKVKIYVDVEGSALPDGARRRAVGAARILASAAVDECIGRIGVTLSASSKLLPDYIDLDLKMDFDSGFRSDLLAAVLPLSRLGEAEHLRWLRDRLEPYGSGVDPLGPTAPALANLLDELRYQSQSPVVQETALLLQRAVMGIRIPSAWVTS
jgi:phosphoglucomutase